MSPLEPPPDYINLPPPFSPLTSCSLIPGPFLPPHPEFSLALLRLCRGAAPSAAHVELHNYCCLITSGPAGAKMPLATARNIFPSAPSVLSGVWKYPATQRDLTPAAQPSCGISGFGVWVFFPSRGPGWCSHPSYISQEYGSSLTRAMRLFRLCRTLGPSEVWLFLFSCLSCTVSGRAGNALCCSICPQQQSSILCSGPEQWDRGGRG